MTIDKNLYPSNPGRLQNLIHYLSMCLLIWGYYYFFCEHLPWFWYDDINVLERAEATSLMDNVTGILKFAPKHYYIDNRPVLIIFSKICRALFGDDPGYHRALKLFAYAAFLVLMLRMLSREGVEKKHSVILLLLFSTLPPVFIVNAWIYEAETLECLLKVAAFGVFWSCVTSERLKSSEHFLKCVLLFLLVILADKTKAPAKIIPVLFLTFLATVRSKDMMLYAASALSLAAVFPYGMVSGGAGSLASGSAAGLLNTFVTQMWGVLAVAVISAVVARKSIFKSNLFVFSLLWLGCELLFYKAYPSTEMRYLYSSMASACFLAAVCLSHGVAALQVNASREVFSSVMQVFLLLFIAANTYWVYNFRASFCSTFILVDKQMKYINDKFNNSLFIYNNHVQFYYQRMTSNRYLSIPLYEQNFRMSIANEIYKTSESVLSDFESASLLMTNNKLSFTKLYEFSSDTNAVYDKFQSIAKISAKSANLYNSKLNLLIRYPAVESLYILDSSAPGTMHVSLK